MSDTDDEACELDELSHMAPQAMCGALLSPITALFLWALWDWSIWGAHGGFGLVAGGAVLPAFYDSMKERRCRECLGGHRAGLDVRLLLGRGHMPRRTGGLGTMTTSYWRSIARPKIAQVLEETKGQDEKAIKRALRDAYPFGSRQYHPYKIWLDEIRRQRGSKSPSAPEGMRPAWGGGWEEKS